MVNFLKGVKTNSMIIMAIQDSSREKNWKDEWIEYVDSLGSETYKKAPMEGCPFIMC